MASVDIQETARRIYDYSSAEEMMHLLARGYTETAFGTGKAISTKEGNQPMAAWLGADSYRIAAVWAFFHPNGRVVARSHYKLYGVPGMHHPEHDDNYVTKYRSHNDFTTRLLEGGRVTLEETCDLAQLLETVTQPGFKFLYGDEDMSFPVLAVHRLEPVRAGGVKVPFIRKVGPVMEPPYQSVTLAEDGRGDWFEVELAVATSDHTVLMTKGNGVTYNNQNGEVLTRHAINQDRRLSGRVRWGLSSDQGRIILTRAF